MTMATVAAASYLTATRVLRLVKGSFIGSRKLLRVVKGHGCGKVSVDALQCMVASWDIINLGLLGGFSYLQGFYEQWRWWLRCLGVVGGWLMVGHGGILQNLAQSSL